MGCVGREALRLSHVLGEPHGATTRGTRRQARWHWRRDGGPRALRYALARRLAATVPTPSRPTKINASDAGSGTRVMPLTFPRICQLLYSMTDSNVDPLNRLKSESIKD